MLEMLSYTHFISRNKQTKASRIYQDLQIYQLSSKVPTRYSVIIEIDNHFAAVKLIINLLIRPKY